MRHIVNVLPEKSLFVRSSCQAAKLPFCQGDCCSPPAAIYYLDLTTSMFDYGTYGLTLLYVYRTIPELVALARGRSPWRYAQEVIPLPPSPTPRPKSASQCGTTYPEVITSPCMQDSFDDAHGLCWGYTYWYLPVTRGM